MSPDRPRHKSRLLILSEMKYASAIDVMFVSIHSSVQSIHQFPFHSFRRARRAAEPAARGPGGLAQRGPLVGSAAEDAPPPGHQLQDLHQVSQSVTQYAS